MSTRALIHLKDEENKTITTIYKHSDGYPEHLATQIKKAFASKERFNGAEDLAGYLVMFLRQLTPDVYIYRPNSKNCSEEFVYTIRPKNKEYIMSIVDVNEQKVVFEDSILNFK